MTAFETCAIFPIESASEPDRVDQVKVVRPRTGPADRFIVLRRDGTPVFNEIGEIAQYTFTRAVREARKLAGWYR